MATTISAKIVADSICPRGHRITSMLLTFPRYILAEFNTHRMFSRNSASSRAIPFQKMLEAVINDPFVPIKWMKEHKGMQGTEYFDQTLGLGSKYFPDEWLKTRDSSIIAAESMHDAGLTKQLCNRLLEPFMWHTVLVTATEWDNFFFQRANEGADIHMQVLVYAMLDAMNSSVPLQKEEGEWHIPFYVIIDSKEIVNLFAEGPYDPELTMEEFVEPYKIKISTAMAARTSYTLVGEEKKQSYVADIKLHDKLWAYPHPSPFEHCAQVPTQGEYNCNFRQYSIDKDNHFGLIGREEGWFGNFRGWKQYRKMLPNENHSFDSRLKR